MRSKKLAVSISLQTKAISNYFRILGKWAYISAQKLEGERSKSFALSISMQSKAIRSYFRVPGTGKDPHFPGNRAKVGHNHDKRKPVSATLSFLK